MPEPRLEPDDAIDRARDMVNALCKPRGIPGARQWILSIPARPDWDPDIVIMDGLRLGAKAMDERDALIAEVARLKAERRSLVERAVRAGIAEFHTMSSTQDIDEQDEIVSDVADRVLAEHDL